MLWWLSPNGRFWLCILVVAGVPAYLTSKDKEPSPKYGEIQWCARDDFKYSSCEIFNGSRWVIVQFPAGTEPPMPEPEPSPPAPSGDSRWGGQPDGLGPPMDRTEVDYTGKAEYDAWRAGERALQNVQLRSDGPYMTLTFDPGPAPVALV